MNTTTNSVTRADALRVAIATCTDAGVDQTIIEKLEHILQLIEKPSESEAGYRARMRGQRAGEFVNQCGHPITAREFLNMTDDPDVRSIQAATAALRKAVALGLISSWFVGEKKSTMTAVYGSHRTVTTDNND